ncbi:cation-dependent mannose-6-phosphate receptor-like [Ceratina calcarata]|uniref:Autophagy-related protein 27 n=1 Tax=Ceratina calcarata TaxID=156304 RepID=A0AAJ7JB06_9HYME|nr:cation-dependent mannose-6-phosphate receptor-like [Ceratina calcarata]
MVARDKIVLVCGLFLMCFCKQTYSECRKLTACSCVFADGEGYDLSPLANSNTSTLAGKRNNSTYYFHPCTNQKLLNQSSDCYKGSGVSLCVVNGNASLVLGKVEETTIVADNSIALLKLNHNNFTTLINLKCCSSCGTELLPLGELDNQYSLTLRSPYACKVLLENKGLSTGSLLLIYFFVFSGIYFVGGAMALKFLRGATGWEMIPNHKFWMDLPSLITEGIVFTFNCCRIDSYERI